MNPNAWAPNLAFPPFPAVGPGSGTLDFTMTGVSDTDFWEPSAGES